MSIYIQVLAAAFVGAALYFVLGLTTSGASETAFFPSTIRQTSTRGTSWVTLQARQPSNDPSNLGSYHVGAKDVKSFKPTVGSHDAGGSPSMPAILAGIPTMLLPGLALVLIFALLRLFRNPLLRLLGVNPVQNDAMYRSPYGSPYGQANPYGQQNLYGAPQPNLDMEASLQQLLQNATPEEAEQLKALADRVKGRAPLGTTAARPAQWVTTEPIPASPAEALTPEERRERARQKARTEASVQADKELKSSTQSWADKQLQTEKSLAGPIPGGFNSLEEDQKLVAVASVVLTAFVVAEADARGYQTR